MNSSNRIPVFVCHYTPLKVRKEHILQELEEFQDEIEVRFIEDYDQEVITEEIERKFFLKDSDEWQKRAMLTSSENNFRIMTKAEKSIALKHYQAIKKIQESGLEYALVIEDDCVLCKNFIPQLRRVIENLPEDWNVYYPNAYPDMYSFANILRSSTKEKACEYIPYLKHWLIRYFKQRHPLSDPGASLLRVQKQPCQHTHRYQASFGAYAYLIHQRSCLPIIESIEKNQIVLPIDWEYSWIYFQNDYKVYIAKQKKATLITTGFFKTMIQHSNKRKKRRNLP